MRHISVFGAFVFLFGLAHAQTIAVRGNITDGQGKPIAFVSIWIDDKGEGAVSNEKGAFLLSLKPGNYNFTFRATGYEQFSQNINAGENPVNLTVRLSKKGRAGLAPTALADTIINNVIARRKAGRDKLQPYQGHLYTKALQQLNGAPKTFFNKDITAKLYLNAQRKGIISLSESIGVVHTLSTGYIKEQVDAARFTSPSEAFNLNSTAELHVDFYQDIFSLPTLTGHNFLSPIANEAHKFYSYRLIAQFADKDKLIDEIAVTPIHPNDEHLFSGKLFILDKEWVLYATDLYLSRQARVDFVDSIRIRQQFVPLTDGNWIPQVMDFDYYGKLFGFKYGGYFLQVYQNITADTAVKTSPYQEVFHSDKESYHKDEKFWADNRAMPLLPEENHFYQLTELAEKHQKDKTVADSLQNNGNHFHFFPYLLNGYTLHNYVNKSSIVFPAPYNIFSYNTVEGFVIDAKVKYTKAYDNQRTLTIIPDARYSGAIHTLSTNIYGNFTYNPFHQASIYGRVGSDFLDLNNTGTISPFINSLSTLLLGNNYLKLYHSRFIMGGADGEVANGVLLNGQLEYAERTTLQNAVVPFNADSVKITSNNPLDPYGTLPLFPSYRALTLKASATFTFNQEYKITPSGKFILPNPYPRVRLNYREGLHILGSDITYNFVSVDVFQDRLNVGIFGYTGYFLSIGTFPNTKNLYYPDYYQFSGGESFFFNAAIGTFHFLNFYTYSTYKTYFQANVEHNFAGYFTSQVPLLRRLNLEEIIGGSYLTQGSLPDYKEVYIGVKRTVFRLDYGFAFGLFNSTVQGFRLSYNF